jgi:hypothetical protein
LACGNPSSDFVLKIKRLSHVKGNFNNSSTKSRNISIITKHRSAQSAQSEKAILASGWFYMSFQLVRSSYLSPSSFGIIIANMENKRGKHLCQSPEFRDEKKGMKHKKKKGG